MFVPRSCAADPSTPSRLAVHRSRHLIAPFRFLHASSFAEARHLLDQAPEAVPLCGGLDIVNRMKEGAGPAAVVWIGSIAGADAIAQEGDDLVIGAACRHDQLARSPLVRSLFPDLAAVWDGIATIRIRSQGSVIGNLMADVPAYEAPVLLAAVRASLIAVEPDGSMVTLPLAVPGESDEAPPPRLVAGLRIPLATHGLTRRLLYDRALRPALSVALCVDMADGHVARARAVLGGCHRHPLVRDLPLAGLPMQALASEAAPIARAAFGDLPQPSVAWAGDSGYRLRVAPVLLGRLVARAAG